MICNLVQMMFVRPVLYKESSFLSQSSKNLFDMGKFCSLVETL